MIFLTMGLQGCAGQIPDLAPLASYEVSGKVGVRDGDQGYSARFNWRQYPQDFVIEVWGPLGQGRTRLVGTARSMQVWRGADLLAAGPAEQVMQAQLGWSLPVDVLPYWLLGRPHAQLPHDHAVLDLQQRFTAFDQAGWQVEMARYEGGQEARPGRIVARQATRTVTVIVREFLQ